MTNLTASSTWSDVPQLEITTPVLGGPGAPSNWQAQALINRTAFLSAAVTAAAAAASTAATAAASAAATASSAVQTSALASTTGGAGGSLVGIQDSVDNFAATNLEDVLAEIVASVYPYRSMRNVMDIIPKSQHAAIKNYTSTYDPTTVINANFQAGQEWYFPSGLFNIDPDYGYPILFSLKYNCAGISNTIFRLLAKGGSVSDLQAYTKGSGFRRPFTVGVANNYVSFFRISDCSIIGQPGTFGTSNYRQILLDLRSVTRSTVDRVYFSNLTDPQTHPWFVNSTPSGDLAQGYGVVIGTRPSSNTDYCGGEENIVRDCFFWNTYKGCTIDDSTLTPLSAAHGTIIDNPDSQGNHEQVTQSSQYTTGVRIQNATIQGSRRQPSNANPTIGIVVTGYNCYFSLKYSEMGSACDNLAGFASSSQNGRGEIFQYSFNSPGAGAIFDSGTKNRLGYHLPVSVVAGGVTVTEGKGDWVELYGGGYISGHIQATIASGVATTIETVGEASLTRIGAGRWRVNLAKQMPTDAYFYGGHAADASGNIWQIAPIRASQSRSSFQFYTWQVLAAGVTNNIDPTYLMLNFKQR